MLVLYEIFFFFWKKGKTVLTQDNQVIMFFEERLKQSLYLSFTFI